MTETTEHLKELVLKLRTLLKAARPYVEYCAGGSDNANRVLLEIEEVLERDRI